MKKILLAILAFGAPALAGAQRAGELQQGARIAVTDVRGRIIEGTLVSLSADSMTIDNRHNLVSGVALDDVKTIKVQHRSYFKGMLIGAAIGGGIGAVGGGVLGGMDNSCNFLACGRGENAAFAAVTTGILGFLGGSVIGLVAGWPVWEQVQGPPRVR